MPKGRKAVRIVFNTYYEKDAEKIINILKDNGFNITKITRSRVVPELYFIEISADNNNLIEMENSIKELIAKNKTDTIFGLKVYSIDASK
ncbi:hypothetical protein PYJP_08880 [Pyrofollis japonicus]|uniref:hypothetical protein n=1 Tax=Pyrofollis japonicus TaxID=3060460 RepID=UPI00295BD38B|nr:hypothetical protein [Pyrofollis japonicus]BEP17536.1 hypothetical protein PYJP_08880 [Pyrofollis japonicus]